MWGARCYRTREVRGARASGKGQSFEPWSRKQALEYCGARGVIERARCAELARAERDKALNLGAESRRLSNAGRAVL